MPDYASRFTINHHPLHGCDGWFARHAFMYQQGKSPQRHTLRGFTLVELIMTMVIVGILAVYAAPRFLGSSVFQSRGFSDQIQASLRYAQKVAIAQHRFVCVNIASNILTLSLGATNTCGTNLQSLSGGANYTIEAPNGITITNINPSFTFDAIGRPSAAQSIAVTGGGMTTTIIVEAETGYVHP